MTSLSPRTRLRFGVVAAIMFPLLTAVQAFTRSGFNLAKDPLSLLSVGDLGWIQMANFISYGFLFVLFSGGIKAVLKPKSFWVPALFAAYGTLMLLAGIFIVDPMLGFPPGTPQGLPASLSWHAITHQTMFFGIFLCILLLAAIFARRFAKERARGWFTFSLFVAIATPALILGAGEPGSSVYGAILYSLNLLTNGWILAIALRYSKVAS